MTSPQQSHVIPREEILSAAEQRARQEPPAMSIQQIARIQETKQQFRRMIDPGIMRPNNKDSALVALKTLAMLSDNLLREPDNAKFQSFKPTNDAIRKRLIDIKGALEYAVALGFHLKVEQFQPTYIFNSRHMEDLRIGNEILKETLNREAEKQEKASHSKLSDKELREIARRNVQLNFQEDRMAKQLKDQQEAQLRAARKAAAALAPAVEAADENSTSHIPQGGITLSGRVEEGPVRRVPFEHSEDEDDE